MIYIPGGSVKLGPRTLSAVPGWTPPSDPTGITPGGGSGNNNRAAGGPPVHRPGGKGVGHVRPGSGMPSAPPNMPGNKAKFTGGIEEKWTANPGNQQKHLQVSVSGFWMDKTEVTRKAYKEFLDEMKNQKTLMDIMKKIYNEYTNITIKELNVCLKKDIYWTPEYCLENGLVDEIL